MFFSSKYFWRCKDAFKNPSHYLFVELRACRKISLLVVIVVNFKRGRTALGIAAHKRRSLELDKVLTTQSLTERLYNCRLHFKNVTRFLRAQGKGHVVEVGVDVKLCSKFKRHFSFGNYLERMYLKLNIAILYFRIDILIRPFVDCAFNTNDILRAHFF